MAPQINSLKLAHERMKPLHERLNGMGAGFNIRDQLINRPEIADEAAVLIRQMGEIVELALECYNNPEKAADLAAPKPMPGEMPAEEF